jgi:hypothetical protein
MPRYPNIPGESVCSKRATLQEQNLDTLQSSFVGDDCAGQPSTQNQQVKVAILLYLR